MRAGTEVSWSRPTVCGLPALDVLSRVLDAFSRACPVCPACPACPACPVYFQGVLSGCTFRVYFQGAFFTGYLRVAGVDSACLHWAAGTRGSRENSKPACLHPIPSGVLLFFQIKMLAVGAADSHTPACTRNYWASLEFSQGSGARFVGRWFLDAIQSCKTSCCQRAFNC